MNSSTHRWCRRLLAVLIIPLLVVGPMPAPVQARAPALAPQIAALTLPAAAPEAAPEAVPEQAADPASPTAEPVIDCDDPIPGERALLIDETEIAVGYQGNALVTELWDNSGQNLVKLVRLDHSAVTALSSIDWPEVTFANLNNDPFQDDVYAVKDKSGRVSVVAGHATSAWYHTGDAWGGDHVAHLDIAAGNLDRADGDDEVVVAFRDDFANIHLGVLNGGTTSWIAEAPSTLYGEWTNWDNGRGDVAYVAVATGDLDGDGFNDEIVVVFRDSNKKLQAAVLRRDSATLTPLWLSGPMAITNNDGTPSDHQLGASYYGSRYPIDVTTGDVDGDKRDEAIIAFAHADPDNAAYYEGSVQLQILKYKGAYTINTPIGAAEQYTIDSRVMRSELLYEVYGHESVNLAQTVSVGAGDMDGDGKDEIALGHSAVWIGNGTYQQQYMATYEYVPVSAPEWMSYQCMDLQGVRDCVVRRNIPGNAFGFEGKHLLGVYESPSDPTGDIRVAVGDIDGDGLAEIAAMRRDDGTGYGVVYTYDAKDAITQRTRAEVINIGDKVHKFWLAMGDATGDSRHGDYTGDCRQHTRAQIAAVIHSPPHWDEEEALANWEEAEAAFGQKAGTEVSYGATTETTSGGSVSIGVGIEGELVEGLAAGAGASFTYGWEKGTAVESKVITTTTEGNKFKTHVPWAFDDASTYFDAIGVVKAVYWCYDYVENIPIDPYEGTPIYVKPYDLGTMEVCLPMPSEEGSFKFVDYSLPVWYSDCPDCPRKLYADSWVPVGINLAQGRTAIESSTYYYEDTGAPKAVDGNTDGNYYAGSMAHTKYEAHPWWRVDLGGVQAIDAVLLWNRTDCCGERGTDFYVFVSDTDFTSNDPAVLANDPNVWSYRNTGQMGTPSVIPVNHHGRFLRVQLAGSNYLQLAEVQVYGVPGTPDQWPISRPVTSTNELTGESNFTITWPGGRQQSVPGNAIYARWGTTLGPEPNSGSGGEFDTSLGSEGELMVEGSTASSEKVGMEVKLGFVKVGGELETTETHKTSYALGWSQETEFSGAVGGGIPSCVWELAYEWKPYVWVQRATSSGGVGQAFLVLDYYVPSVGGSDPACPTGLVLAAAPNGPAAVPATPLLTSPTHPDGNAWGGSTATFDWAQPPGDATAINGYRWVFDQAADSVPPARNAISATVPFSATYNNLPDGTYFMHVHAQSTGGEWSQVAHRTLKVDANPPTVQVTLDPANPTGQNGWYVTTVTVSVAADDGNGSDVAAIEVSTDGGATWQTYGGNTVTLPPFAADTTGTTVQARASDHANHTSAPVSASFKIDATAPDSHPGAQVATFVTTAQNQRRLLLAGSIADAASGGASMDIGVSVGGKVLDWTAATHVGVPGTPPAQVNWAFTSTHEVGAGNYIFLGRAHDAAGNAEPPYQIASVGAVPTASPDLVGSSLAVSPTAIRPGEVVTYTLVARNGGFQEAFVAMTATLPAGLVPLIPDSLVEEMKFDSATGALVWQKPALLWPGQWALRTFQAQAGAALAAGTLESTATFHAFWPNMHDPHEQTVVKAASIAVNPALPAGADKTPPWVLVTRLSKQGVAGNQAALAFTAAPDAASMLVRQWTADPTTGAWVAAGSSGWIDFAAVYTATLSPGQGVKYLGVWVMDAAGNVSTLDEGSLTFVNRIDGSQPLAAGQRVQYRADVEPGAWAVAVLTTDNGDPDLYAWAPRNAFRPDIFTNDAVGPGQSEAVGGQIVQVSGRVLIEVIAATDSQYHVAVLTPEVDPATAAARAAAVKPLPEHPLTVADPLSAGVATSPDDVVKFLLPLILRGQ